MRWLLKTRRRRIFTGVFVLVCILAIVGWRLNRLKIGHATLAQILAALPPDLRTGKQVDEAACKRMDRLGELSKIDWGPWPDEFYDA